MIWRIGRGLGALVALAAIIVGVPWLLITMVGNPLPGRVDLQSIWQVLSRPDDGTILVRLIAVIAWIAWLVFTVAVVLELIAVLSRQRIRIRLPGLGGPQKIAGGLVLLVMAMFVAPQQLAAADPVGAGHHTDSSTRTSAGSVSAPSRAGGSAGDTGNQRSTTDGVAADAGTLIHTVQPGDDLWTLSEHYYGRGQDWRRIAEANPALLTGGPDRLQPGWRLRIPDVDPSVHRIVAKPGDSLSSIAEREYGDSEAWYRIYQANRGVLTDPDLLPTGVSLIIPAADDHPSRQGAATGHAHDEAPVRDHHADDDQHAAGDQGASGDQGISGEDAGSDDQAAGDQHRVGGPGESPDRQEQPGTAAPDAPGRTARPASGEAATGGLVSELSSHAIDVAGIGGLMAAALIGGLATRRQLQLRTRGVGRRIPHPPPVAQQLETELGRRQTPHGLELLDLALRAIGRDYHRKGRSLPRLQAARAADDDLVLLMSEPDLPAPVGFLVDGRSWRLETTDVDFLAQDNGVDNGVIDAAQPYPGLTSLGTGPDGATVLINLEAAGLFAVSDHDAGAAGVLTAMATELAFSSWADELVITLVGDDRDLAASIDRYNVSTVSDLDHLLDRWEQRARVQRDHLRSDPGSSAGDYRVDPDLADPWVPEVGLIFAEPDTWQAERLERLLLSEPPVTMAAVVCGDGVMTDWRLVRDTSSMDAELAPLGWPLTAQQVTEPVGELLTELIGITGSQQTEPAPWWASDFAEGSHPPARALIGPPSDEQPDVLSAEDRPADPAVPAASRDDLHTHPADQPGQLDDRRSDTSDDQLPDTPDDGLSGAADDQLSDPADDQLPEHFGESSEQDRERVGEEPGKEAGEPTDEQVAERLITLPLRVFGEQAAAAHAANHVMEEPNGNPIGVVASRQVVAENWPSVAVRVTGDPVEELVARSDVDWAWLPPVDRPSASEESDIVPNPFAGASPQAPRHPTIMLLGPAELLGTAGERPHRAVMQCIEYCTWLLEHPGSTAQAMAAALAVAEGTRRSNMSRLRNWLGSDDLGEPYLPDAYSGKIMLSPLVSSDWHRLQLLTHAGVNRTSIEALASALDLVRGAPLADAAPGQWHWAEEMRTDMVSVIRDIGVELTDRALAQSDIDLARWAASRALTAAPQDEFLMGSRIRTEHQAGNPAEVERLALQLAAQGRALGVDLHPETVDLLQQVMEGRLRARA